MDKPAEHNHRQEDSKRLVRFCEAEESEKLDRRSDVEQNAEEVIMLGSNMYFINNPDPNSAVRKLFPNSKPTPINPFLNKQPKSFNTIKTNPFTLKTNVNNYNTINRIRSKSDNEEQVGTVIARRKVDKNTLRRNMLKFTPEIKQKPNKGTPSPTPLIERIKELTCDSEKESIEQIQQEERKCNESIDDIVSILEATQLSNCEKKDSNCQYNIRDLPKKTKEGLNMMKYNENITQTKLHNSSGVKQVSPTDEARRSFLSSLSHQIEEAGDRNSLATISTTADTVYSLSDIEEALTEEEKEIRDAFAQEIKQDELELFVQQDAGRTERLRKRYSSTPKPANPMPMLFSNKNYPQINSDLQHYSNSNTLKKDKPKFGSTVEILQQLQQQIETPYQLEGRRTACSNYSDTSIPISDRLFCDESSDGYEPVQPKLSVHRTCSLDSKNYEEIENFPSAFSVPRTKSQEHPRLTHFESDTYFRAAASARYPKNFSGGNHLLEQNVYTSSPDLHGFHNQLPDRFASYNNLPTNGRQLHPVLQRQYCRYPVSERSQRSPEEDKVLTPPSRMHTYMNVPTNAPCYLSPPPYSKTNHYTNPPPNHNDYQYAHPNIYQNVPLPMNPHLMTLRRLCTEKERGVPEGASSSQESRESYTTRLSPPKDYYFRSSLTNTPKPSSLPHQYCVDV